MVREGKAEASLMRAVKMYPTPNARDTRGQSIKRDRLPDAVGGDMIQQTGLRLNPEWTDWLMGYPIGHSALKPLEMDKFQQWLQQFGDY